MRTVYTLAVLIALMLPTLAGAEVFKCVVDGKVVYKAQAGEGCEQKELKVAPYDPEEAARTEAQARRMDQRHAEFEAAQQEERKRQERLYELRQAKRVADEQAAARRAQDQTVRELQRSNAMRGMYYPQDQRW